MKKTIAALLMVLMLVSTAGCTQGSTTAQSGPEENPQTTSVAPPEPEPVESQEPVVDTEPPASIDISFLVTEDTSYYDVTAIDPIDEKYFAMLFTAVKDAYISGEAFGNPMPDGIEWPEGNITFEQLEWVFPAQQDGISRLLLPLNDGQSLVVWITTEWEGEEWQKRPTEYRAVDAFFE